MNFHNYHFCSVIATPPLYYKIVGAHHLVFYVCFGLQARVSDLYKKGSDEAEKRVDELLKALEKMKALVDDVSKERDELATSLQAKNIRYFLSLH